MNIRAVLPNTSKLRHTMSCHYPTIPHRTGCSSGYLGTAYHALKSADVHYGSTVLINGATGTVGTGAVLSALAMGAVKNYCCGK